MTPQPSPLAVAGYRPLVLAWSTAFALLVFLERGSARIPAYHDGRLHFDVAWSLRDHLFFPFVATLDTGHPPLVSFLLASTWLFPVPRLLSMHLLAWAAAALFVAAVFEVGRRALGLRAAVFAAGLLFLHPVFAAQAIELNLDLFHAAFAWVAILGVVIGNPLVIAVAGTAAALTKLNGLFTVAGLLLWTLGRLLFSRDLQAKHVVSALVPLGVPVVVFGVYHAAKLAFVGHLFATPEFEDDNLTFVRGFAEYGVRLSHAFDQITGFRNPNLWAVRAFLVAGAGALVAFSFQKRRGAPGAPRPEGAPPTPRSDLGFYRPLLPAETLSLIAVVAAVHVGLWSVRSYLSLVRYFLLVYPVLYLLLAASIARLPVRFRSATFALVGLPLAALFAVQARPTEAARWFPGHTRALLFPPSSIGTNYENSLELVDLMTVLRRTAAVVEQRSPGVHRIRAKWPFEAYLTDPRHGIVRTARDFSPEDPELIVETSTAHPGVSARDVDCPPGFELAHMEQVGRVWIALFAPESRDASER